MQLYLLKVERRKGGGEREREMIIYSDRVHPCIMAIQIAPMCASQIHPGHFRRDSTVDRTKVELVKSLNCSL